MMSTDSQEKLILDNLNLVDHILQKQMYIYPNNQYYEDYRQEGRIGLILAARRFDEGKGYQFTSFAGAYIKGWMLRFHREFLNRYIHVSRKALDIAPEVVKLYYEGYSPEETMKILNISERIYLAAITTISLTSLDTPIKAKEDSENLKLTDVLGAEDENIENLFGEERVLECIEKVANIYKKDIHKSIWYDWAYPAYYGEKVNQEEIAEKYHISQAQVSRILVEGKCYLKRYLEE